MAKMQEQELDTNSISRCTSVKVRVNLVITKDISTLIYGYIARSVH